MSRGYTRQPAGQTLNEGSELGLPGVTRGYQRLPGATDDLPGGFGNRGGEGRQFRGLSEG
jgi:hypothetical protein